MPNQDFTEIGYKYVGTSAADKFAAQTQKISNSLEKSRSAVEAANEAGFKSKAVLKQQIDAYSNYTGTIEKAADGTTTMTGAISKTIPKADKFTNTIKTLDAAGAKVTDTMISQEGATTQYNKAVDSSKNLNQKFSKTQKSLDEAGRTVTKTLKTQEGAASSLTTTTNSAKNLNDKFTKSTISYNRAGAKVTDTIRRQTGVATAYNRVIDETRKTTDSYIKSWGFFTRVIAASLVSRAISLVSRAFIDGSNSAREFEIRISELRTISQKSELSFGSWSDAILKLSGDFGRAPLDVAEGAYQALSNQIAEGAETIAFMEEALRLSLITVSTTEEAVLALTGALNAYGLGAEEARSVSDKLFKTVELGRIRLKDMSSSIGQVLIVSNQLGISMDEALASIARLTIQGLGSSQAMTGLRNVMLKLVRPTDAMKSLFAEWGVESGQAAFETFGFIGVINKLTEAANTGKGELAEFGELFGRIRAITGIAGLASDTKTLAESIDEIKNSTLSANEAFKRINESIGFKLNKEIQKARAFFIKFGQDVNAIVVKTTELIGGLSKAIEYLVKAIGALALAVAVLSFSKFIIFLNAATTGTYSLTAALWALSSSTLYTRLGSLLALLSNPITIALTAGLTAGYIATKILINELDRAKKSVYDFAEAVKGELAEAFSKVGLAANEALSKFVDLNNEALVLLTRRGKQAIASSKAEFERLAGIEKTRRSIAEIALNLEFQLASKKRQQEILYQKSLRARADLIKAIRDNDFKAAKEAENNLIQLFQTAEGLKTEADKKQDRRFAILKKRLDAGIPVEVSTRDSPAFDKFLRGKGDVKNVVRDALKSVKQLAADFDRLNEKTPVKVFENLTKDINDAKLLDSRLEQLGERFIALKDKAKATKDEIVRLYTDAASIITGLIEKLPKYDFSTAVGGTPEFSNKNKDLIASLKSLLAEVNRVALEPSIVTDPEYAAEQAAAVKQIADSIPASLAKSIPDLQTAIRNLGGIFNVLSTDSEKLVNIKADLSTIQGGIEELSNNAQAMDDFFNRFNATATAGTEQFILSAETLSKYSQGQAQTLINILRELRVEIERTKKATNFFVPSSTPSTDPYDLWRGGYIKRFAGGGSVGSDTVPAMLSPGEFVLNKQSARQFLPLLTAMNSRAASGGVITNNNIGDISVNVSGTGYAEPDARRIAAEIRRELKRGTVRLN